MNCGARLSIGWLGNEEKNKERKVGSIGVSVWVTEYEKDAIYRYERMIFFLRMDRNERRDHFFVLGMDEY